MAEPVAPMFGIAIHPLTRGEALAQVRDWLAEAPADGHCRYVVTPNVDHVLKLRQDRALREAYAQADLVIADGWPLRSVSGLFGPALPETLPGSDFVEWLLDDLDPPAEPGAGLRIFLLGAAQGVAEEAAKVIAQRWPGVSVVGCLSPPRRFERDEALCRAICRHVASCRPDLLILGLGAPLQEVFAHRHRALLGARVALCVGATIDFLAGHRRRAPRLMRRLRLEWLHRVITEPRRLGPRYLRGLLAFPMIVLGELLARVLR
ncbi:MAG: hypothetical protein RL456_2332 [Pseudomonadota bacterium]|jgi:N-acetylglucosaminyldiphosphoundecaprenol N-acetyl-beta-D-mannosaminyltransferase